MRDNQWVGKLLLYSVFSHGDDDDDIISQLESRQCIKHNDCF